MKKVENQPHRKLKGIRATTGTKQIDLCNIMNMSPTTFSHKENGKAEFTITEVKTIIDFFQLPFESIFF